VKIVKRLEILKSSLELEDDDVIEMQVHKLELENIEELSHIILLCKEKYKNIDKIIKLIEDYIYTPKGNELTPHQSKVYNLICDEFETILDNEENEISSKNNFVSLSGFAGVGKTFLISKLIEYFIKKKDYKILLTTPTHKSLAVAKYMLDNNNLKVPTITLQSYLDIKLYTDYNKGTKVFKRDKVDIQADFEKDLDILLVDESSMISNELLEFIKENLLQNKLKSVLFIGDPYQLPPIDEGENGVQILPKTYYLTEVVRQAKDSYIKTIAIELKDCIANKSYRPIMDILNIKEYKDINVFYEEKDMYEDFCSYEKWYEKNNMILSYTNDNVDDFNRLIRTKYWLEQNITPTQAIIEGEILIFNESYKRKFRSSEVVKIYKVDKQQNNTITLEEENGNSFVLEFFDCICEDGRSFKTVIPEHYKLYNIFLSNLAKQAKNEKVNETRKALWKKFFAIKEDYADLKYTYSSTIHKSQGSTFSTVYIDLSPILNLFLRDKDLAFRLLYVAVTRASKNINILL
jgi:hypothetical protein